MPSWLDKLSRPFRSLQKKILFVFMILILPLLLLLVYYNFYAIEVIRNQVAHSNANLLKLYMATIDKELENADQYLYSLASQDSDLLVVDAAENANSEAYHLARIRLFNKLTNDIVNYKNIGILFMYSSVNRDLLTSASQQLPYSEREWLRGEIIDLMNKEQPPSDTLWFVSGEPSAPSLYRVIRFGGVYIGAQIRIDNLMVPFESTDLGEDGKVLLVDDQFQAVPADPFIAAKGIEFRSAEPYAMTGSRNAYMLVSESSSKGKFGVFAIIPEKQMMENIPFLRGIVRTIVLATIVVMPVVYLFLRQLVLVPMRRVVTAMRRIKSGDWEARIQPHPSSDEFSIINDTFNSMVDQIKELKIHVYEEQLTSQKAELKHLQLQINPHFFLNSLNIVYQLAQVKNYALIQEMSLSLVHYFRYMFRSNMSFVPLKDEIEHTRNYLRIQQLRFPELLTCDLEAEQPLMTSLVPPLICQTFVENSIKYAVSMDASLHISVRFYVDEADDRYMWIAISDTGKGFAEDVLDKLSNGIDLDGDPGDRVGIWNIRRRLRLLYPKEDTRIEFANAEQETGAIVRMRLPITHAEA